MSKTRTFLLIAFFMYTVAMIHWDFIGNSFLDKVIILLVGLG